MDLQEKSHFEDLSSLHHYRTELPNILFAMRLDPFVFKTYCVFKMTAGDRGGCFKTNDTLCDEIGCSLPTLVKSKKELIERGLIAISKQKHPSGGSMPDLIQIVDIWPKNMQYLADLQAKKMSKKPHENSSEGGKLDLGGGVKQIKGGGKPGLDKQERNDNKNKNKKNDKGAEPPKAPEKDRSSDAQHPIVSFCPQQYTFPDGSKISLRMQRAIAKYSEKDRQKLCAAIAYLEEQIRQKVKPKTSYEQWLQACIKHDYAGKQAREWQNRTYALWAKIEHDLKNVKILKTVVQVISGDSEPPRSISFSLPEETFSEVIDAEIRKTQNT